MVCNWRLMGDIHCHLLPGIDDGPATLDEALKMAETANAPVITHPERNGIIRSHPERLARWVQQGCTAQVTGGALTGAFGRDTQKIAEQWIAQGLIHFVASDAHNLKGRPLALRPAYEAVKKRQGGRGRRGV